MPTITDSCSASIVPPPEIPFLISAKEVAEILSVSSRWVWQLVDDGRLGRVKLGNRLVRFKIADIVALIESCEEPCVCVGGRS